HFNSNGYGYLHISPVVPLLTLAPKDIDFAVRLVLDGKLIGAVPLGLLSGVLRNSAHDGQNRVFIIHCALGFNVDQILEFRSAFMPARSFYWIHDYSSLCEGFNLLRNDVTFCWAPPPLTMACRVCVYGSSRSAHRAEMTKLFQQCNFDVLAPSQTALDLWLRVGELPYSNVHAHPHWVLKAERARYRRRNGSDAKKSSRLPSSAFHRRTRVGQFSANSLQRSTVTSGTSSTILWRAQRRTF